MPTLATKIMRRINGHGRGNWVCTPKDFLDLGNRAAVDRVLSRLVEDNTLRRIGRGLYDLPRTSDLLHRPVPPSLDAAVRTIARRDRLQILPDGIVAAHELGLTNAVPVRNSYITDGTSRVLKVGARTVKLQSASPKIMRWAGRPGVRVIQALAWLGKDAASDPMVADMLRSNLPDVVKADLMQDVDILPVWMATIVRNACGYRSVAA
jgi:hypothetical protein